MLHACGGDENTRPGFDNWRQPVGQTESVANRLPEGRAKRVNPPLTAIFEKELVRKYGLFFFACCTPAGGMRTPDRGSTTGDSQLDRLRAQRTGCPKGERSESIPPSPPYSRKSSYESTGFFFACCTPAGGMRTPDRGSTTGDSQLDR